MGGLGENLGDPVQRRRLSRDRLPGFGSSGALRGLLEECPSDVEQGRRGQQGRLPGLDLGDSVPDRGGDIGKGHELIFTIGGDSSGGFGLAEVTVHPFG
ncbi:hypothetical protein [Actinokineospora sp. NPDC004072]